MVEHITMKSTPDEPMTLEEFRAATRLATSATKKPAKSWAVIRFLFSLLLFLFVSILIGVSLGVSVRMQMEHAEQIP